MFTFLEDVLEIAVGVLLADYVVSGKGATQIAKLRNGAQKAAARVSNDVAQTNETLV